MHRCFTKLGYEKIGKYEIRRRRGVHWLLTEEKSSGIYGDIFLNIEEVVGGGMMKLFGSVLSKSNQRLLTLHHS